MESPALIALGLGFLLGLKHATDADHVVAVSTIVSEYHSAWRGVWVGASWGLGHTTPLLIVGTAILLIKGSLIDVYDEYSHYLEFGVGIMLVLLGLQVFWRLKGQNLHVHEHTHQETLHMHIHSHDRDVETVDKAVHPFLALAGKPVFRVKSYVIGVVHGLAGSAAVMLAVLATDAVPSFFAGMGYLLLFGVGTVLSMATLTILMGIPFSLSSQSRRINAAVAGLAATASIGFGFLLMYELAIVEGL